LRHKHVALCSVGHMSAISAACKACVQQHITEAGVPRKERYLLDEYIFLLIAGADANPVCGRGQLCHFGRAPSCTEVAAMPERFVETVMS